MTITMCAFIASRLGRSLTLCDLPRNLENQKMFDAEVQKLKGYWIREPFPAIVFCESDNRDFGDKKGTSRLKAETIKPIDLSKVGHFQKTYGMSTHLFRKNCSQSGRAFVQLAYAPVNVRERDSIPKLHFDGSRFPMSRKLYGYIHRQSNQTGIADQNQEKIRDITPDYSVIEVSTGAGYPYLEPFSPNIDFSFTIHVHRLANKYKVEIIGKHNQFPCYELFIKGDPIYKYDTKGSGPDPINLNQNFSFKIIKHFAR